MKSLILPFIAFSLIIADVKAQAVAGDAGQVTQQVTITNALEEIAQTDPEVKTALASCYDNPVNPQNGNSATVSECLWASLTPAKQQQITEALNEFREESKGVTTGVNLRDYTQQSQSANSDALEKLQSFYSNRLEEELGTKNKSFTTNDQNTYFQLAKTQLGKNVTTAWSNFCLEAVWGNFAASNAPEDYKLIIPKQESDRTKVRNANLATLRNVTKSDPYVKCVVHIPLLCHQEKGIPKIFKGEANPQKIDYRNYTGHSNDVTEFKNFLNGSFTDISELKAADLEYTKTRACETYAYAESVRKQLQATEKVADKFNESMNEEMSQVKLNGQQWQGFALTNQQRESDIIDVERATTITSGDLVNGDDSYYQAVRDNEARLAPCMASNNQLADVNNEECQRLLASRDDIEQLKQTGATLMLETEAMKAKIAQASNVEAQKQIIADLRPDLAIDELTNAQITQEFQKIQNTYEDERTELVRSLSEQVNRLQEGQTQQDTSDKITAAANSLLKRGNEYVQLMHFNNIVTGLLAVEKSGGETSQNTRVINLELSSVASLDAQSTYSRGAGNNATLFSEQSNQQRSQQLRENVEIDTTERSSDVTRLKAEDMAKFNDYEISP